MKRGDSAITRMLVGAVLLASGGCKPAPASTVIDLPESSAAIAPVPEPPRRSARKASPWRPGPTKAVHVAEGRYVEPADSIVELLESPRPPAAVVHVHAGQVALAHREGLIPFERLSRPSLGLAGLRVDPANSTLVGTPYATRLELVSLEDPARRRELSMPDDTLVADLAFSPDGSRLAATLVHPDEVDVAVIDVETGELRELGIGPLNAIWGPPCTWVGSDTLLCRRRGTHGEPPEVEAGPNVQEIVSGAAPVRTFSNLLRNANDDALFTHYGAVELAFVTMDGQWSTSIASGLLAEHALSPDGQYLLLGRLQPPFPRLVPVERFPRDLDVFEIPTGRRVRRLHAADTSVLLARGTSTGPRMLRWIPGEPAALSWVERVEKRDVVRRLDAPFFGVPKTLEGAFVDVRQLETTTLGTTLLVDRTTNGQMRLYRLGEPPRLLAAVDEQDRHGHFDGFVREHAGRGRVLEHRGRVYLRNEAPTRSGPRPYLQELDIRTGKARDVFVSGANAHEEVVAVLDPKRMRLLVSHESPTRPPSLVVTGDGEPRAITAPAPVPQALVGVERKLLRYVREDGVELSAMLYLPPGHTRGQRLPVVFWIYPREFSDESYAAQAMEAPNRWFDVRGPSRFAFLAHGYALLDSPSMPIVGSRQSAQSDYIEQLVASARAAAQTLVDAGIADPDRLVVVGRSYGAFSAANLMAHSDLFAAAIAMNGAYNRTLTPFGFQSESRSFWQRQDAYVGMSPFFFADRVRRPVLLIHGENDDNPGTPVEQSGRFFAALAGNGVPTRFVSLPFEGHSFRARESVLHVVAEMLDWVDRHVPAERPSRETD